MHSRFKHAGTTVERKAALTNATGGMHASPLETWGTTVERIARKTSLTGMQAETTS
jgi:hypothetical protein